MRERAACSSRGGLQDDEEAEFQAVHLVSTLLSREDPKFETMLIHVLALTSVNGPVTNPFLLSPLKYEFSSCQGPKLHNSIVQSWCGVSIVSLPFALSACWERPQESAGKRATMGEPYTGHLCRIHAVRL